MPLSMPSVSSDIPDLIAVLRDVLPDAKVPVPLHEPVFAGKEKEYTADCIDTGWVSSVGSYVNAFEEKVAAVSGVNYAVAAVNGTAALFIALKLAGVGPGDEVLIPTLTFVATANAVAYCDATPHFIDSAPNTLGVDPVKLAAYLTDICDRSSGKTINKRTGKRIAAIVPVHIFGHPVDMDPLCALAAQYDIPVVEDAAESLGSLYKGRKAGSLGLVSALSFNGNKIVTTGGGGAILTNDKDLAVRAKHLTTTAKQPHAWAFNHDQVGYNFRLPNINAALGCAQLEQLDGFLKSKRALARAYEEAFRGMNSVTIFKETDFARSNYWLNAILLDSSIVGQRDVLLADMHKAGFMCRSTWTPMHDLPMYKDCPRMDVSVATDLCRRIINLPSGAALGLRYVPTYGDAS